MLYYEFVYKCENLPIAARRDPKADTVESIYERSLGVNRKFDKRAKLYLAVVSENTLTLCAAFDFQKPDDCPVIADAYINMLKIKGKRVRASEITISQFLDLLSIADRHSYTIDEDEVKKELGLSCFGGSRYEELEESLIDRTFTEKQAAAQCRKLMCCNSLNLELARIFAPKTQNRFLAHPVHYVILSDDPGVRSEIRDILLGSLAYVKRLENRRVCFLSPKRSHKPFQKFSLDTADSLYPIQNGGTIVIQSTSPGVDESFTLDEIKKLSTLVYANHRQVLTIIEHDKSDSASLAQWMDSLTDVPFVCLKEECISRKAAVTLLKRKAKADGTVGCGPLQACLPLGKSEFSTKELRRIYDEWYGEHLRTVLYPQYHDITVSQRMPDDGSRGDAFSQLENMVGLTEAKAIIRQMIAFHNTRQLLERRGLNSSAATMHMVFSGSPGTAKTTVARLVAAIMKEYGLLSVGELVECGRADLVDRYVGGTALRVRALFKRAKGSVLFIDEAYSLMDWHRGLYGDEAISTLVQEMENAREHTAVILAGYSEKMNEFLSINPGLRSRIAFHVPFPDYNVEELSAILNLIARKESMYIEDEAQPKIKEIIAEAMQREDFGNGRFVRNLFEQARMKQAVRLMAYKDVKPSDEFLRTLISDDFTLPSEYLEKKYSKSIGFRI